MKTLKQVLVFAAGDIRLSLCALVIALGGAMVLPANVSAHDCGPSNPAEGCSCQRIGNQIPCGCCEDAEGLPTCLYCPAT